MPAADAPKGTLGARLLALLGGAVLLLWAGRLVAVGGRGLGLLRRGDLEEHAVPRRGAAGAAELVGGRVVDVEVVAAVLEGVEEGVAGVVALALRVGVEGRGDGREGRGARGAAEDVLLAEVELD